MSIATQIGFGLMGIFCFCYFLYLFDWIADSDIWVRKEDRDQ
ncbi:hypothetical protein EVB99_055 [Rhizobium phage RHph_N3_19]|nr:hypothetical protein EVB99_055 [Rhizobium phage RHph_N3_19]